MANWAGTYSISAGATGNSTGSNGSTTFNATAANWPTGAQGLTNWTVRILSGTGAGQTRVISSNTATQLIVSAWGVIPDASSAYEIVLVLKNGDHVTASVTLAANVITELEDSATIYFDGNYTWVFDTSSVVRWNKSEATLVTFEANNRAVQGKAGFWNYIGCLSTKTSSAPLISYLKVRDCTHALFLAPSGALGDATTCHHIWSENTSSSMAYMTGAAAPTNMRLANFYNRGGTGSSLSFCATNNVYTQIFERMWSDNSLSGGPLFSTTTGNLSWVRDCVFSFNAANQSRDVASGKEFRVSGCYARGNGGPGMVFLGMSTLAAAGTYRGYHNVFQQGRPMAGAAAASTATLLSHSNDMTARHTCSLGAIDIGQANSYSVATSTYDYIAGNLGAAYENIDTTALTTSNASPIQYKNLTAARANPKAAYNFPFVIDNVVAGTPTDTQVAVAFDCANGAEAGQCTTVSGDSASGQAVLNVASSTQVHPGMMLEIGYGTARSEALRVASVGSGTITFEANLAFTHTAAQGDTVKPQLRHFGLPFVRYGTASGVYNMATDIPPVEDWGLYFTGLKTTYKGTPYTWQRAGHSVTIRNLNANTTYYAKAFAFNPLGQLIEASGEFTFTTQPTAGYTDPGVANVRAGTTYNFANPGAPNRTGTMDLPAASNVHVGVQFDGASKTGSYDGSDRWSDPGVDNVYLGVQYKANSPTNNRTGVQDSPEPDDVRIGVVYDHATKVGTYDGSDRWTDPGAPAVLNGVPYKANGVTPNRTGSLVFPTAAQNAAAIWGEDLTRYATPGTAGVVVKAIAQKVRNLLALVLS